MRAPPIKCNFVEWPLLATRPVSRQARLEACVQSPRVAWKPLKSRQIQKCAGRNEQGTERAARRVGVIGESTLSPGCGPSAPAPAAGSCGARRPGMEGAPNLGISIFGQACQSPAGAAGRCVSPGALRKASQLGRQRPAELAVHDAPRGGAPERSESMCSSSPSHRGAPVPRGFTCRARARPRSSRANREGAPTVGARNRCDCSPTR